MRRLRFAWGAMALGTVAAALALTPTRAAAATCSPETAVSARAGTTRLIDTGCPAGAVLTDLASTSGAAVAEVAPAAAEDPRLIAYTAAPGPGFPVADEVTFKADGEAQAIPLTLAGDADSQPRCRPAALTVSFAETAAGSIRCYEPDGDPVVVEGTTAAAQGTTSAGALASGPGVRELPVNYALGGAAGPAAGSDAFTVRLHEAFGSAPATQPVDVSVTIPADSAPVCTPVTRPTPYLAPFAFQVYCGDTDPGDPLTYSIATASLHSVMAFDNAGAGSYRPVAGFSGTDQFTFRASDGRTASEPAAFNVIVARPPVRRVIASTIRAGFRMFPGYTAVASLRVAGIPAAARMSVRCSGRGCGFAARAVSVARGRGDAAKLFAAARLRAGAIVEVRLTAPGYVGKATRYFIRSGRVPVRRDYCLAPGSAVLRRRC